MLQAEELHQSRKFYGYVQSFSVNPYLKIVLTTENLIRLYHEYLTKDVLYLDATGQLTSDLTDLKGLYTIRFVFGTRVLKQLLYQLVTTSQAHII